MIEVREGWTRAVLRERASLLPCAYSSPRGHLGRRSYYNSPHTTHINHLESFKNVLSFVLRTYHVIIRFNCRWRWIESSHKKMLETSPSHHYSCERERDYRTVNFYSLFWQAGQISRTLDTIVCAKARRRANKFQVLVSTMLLSRNRTYWFEATPPETTWRSNNRKPSLV